MINKVFIFRRAPISTGHKESGPPFPVCRCCQLPKEKRCTAGLCSYLVGPGRVAGGNERARRKPRGGKGRCGTVFVPGTLAILHLCRRADAASLLHGFRRARRRPHGPKAKGVSCVPDSAAATPFPRPGGSQALPPPSGSTRRGGPFSSRFALPRHLCCSPSSETFVCPKRTHYFPDSPFAPATGRSN